MLRSTASKVMWVGRATVFMVGLSVILALVFGVASAAFGANGDTFILGQNNVSTLITRLAGPEGVNGAMFEVRNNNADDDDTALGLKVQPAEAPMTVNSQTKVTNLNADQLDGTDSTDFIQGRGRMVREAKAVAANSTTTLLRVPGVLELDFNCPNTITNNGSLVFWNNTPSQANLFSDNGGANPVHQSLGAALSGSNAYSQGTAASGEFITFQMQSANGKFVTVWLFSVNRQASNDCHIQAQALIGD